jgi:short-subunit dehydrogenase
LQGTVVPYAVDVTDVCALQDVSRDFTAKFGAPDIVIANAGRSAGTSSEDIADVAILRKVLDVNVAGMAATLAAFAPAMRRAGRGTLVSVASVASFRGLAGNGAYSASKAAARVWTESLRTELHGSGVSVVCVCPGYVDTPLTRVNGFRMPFLLSADQAAPKIARAIAARRRVAVIPWQMALVSLAMRSMPDWLYDRLAAGAPRKPRGLSSS